VAINNLLKLSGNDDPNCQLESISLFEEKVRIFTQSASKHPAKSSAAASSHGITKFHSTHGQA
jgi:hypothetical protein